MKISRIFLVLMVSALIGGCSKNESAPAEGAIPPQTSEDGTSTQPDAASAAGNPYDYSGENQDDVQYF